MNVKPMATPLVSERGLALRYLIGVVRKGVIYTAAMNIKIFAEMLFCDARALNMPTGISDSPRGIPF